MSKVLCCCCFSFSFVITGWHVFTLRSHQKICAHQLTTIPQWPIDSCVLLPWQNTWKNNLRKGRFILAPSLRVQSIKVGKSERQEYEVGSCVVYSEQRKLNIHNHFIGLQSTNSLKISDQRFISKVIPDPAKLTINIKHHSQRSTALRWRKQSRAIYQPFLCHTQIPPVREET